MMATNNSVDKPPKTTDFDIILNYLRNNSYIELKTNRLIQHWKQEQNFKYVLWAVLVLNFIHNKFTDQFTITFKSSWPN